MLLELTVACHCWCQVSEALESLAAWETNDGDSEPGAVEALRSRRQDGGFSVRLIAVADDDGIDDVKWLMFSILKKIVVLDHGQ